MVIVGAAVEIAGGFEAVVDVELSSLGLGVRCLLFNCRTDVRVGRMLFSTEEEEEED